MPGGMLRAFQYRNYRWFWFAGIGHAFGQGMQMFTLAWLTLVVTDGSLSRLGIMVLLQGLPILGFSVFGGVMADRIDRRFVVMAGQLMMAVVLLILAVLTITDLVRIWHIYVAAVAVGTGRAFVSPARMALMRDIVEREDVMNAMALNQLVLNAAMVFTAPLAGIIIDRFSTGPALILDGSFYLIGAALILFIRGLENFRSTLPRASVGRDLIEGLRYARSSPAVLSILVLGTAITLFGSSYGSLLPGFAREVLELGATKAGFLRTAWAAGAVAGNIGMVALGDFRYKNWLWLGVALQFTVMLFIFAITPWFELSLVVLFFVGLGEMTFVAMGAVLIQLQVPRALLGRIISLWTTVGSMMLIGAFAMGIVGDAFNLRVAFAGGAVICLLFFLWVGVVQSKIRRMSLEQPSDREIV
jgi:MFS family permease